MNKRREPDLATVRGYNPLARAWSSFVVHFLLFPLWFGYIVLKWFKLVR